jgi:hypothetical protein
MRERDTARTSSFEKPASFRSNSPLIPYQSQPQSTDMIRKPIATRRTASRLSW